MDALKKSLGLLPRLSIANTTPTQIYVPENLLLVVANTYPDSTPEFRKHVKLQRTQPKSSISGMDLPGNSQVVRVVYLKGHFWKVNESLAPVITSDNCSAAWLGKETQQMQGIDLNHHAYYGLVVTLKSGNHFSLTFDKGTCVDIDSMMVCTSKLQRNENIELQKMFLACVERDAQTKNSIAHHKQ